MVNLVQRSGEGPNYHKNENTHKCAPGSSDGVVPLRKQGIGEQKKMQESESDSNSSEDFDELIRSISPDEGALEFEDTEFEKLVKEEGPQQILQLTMQYKTDELMREELTDDDDYADWIQWGAYEERRMQSVSEAAIVAEESVLLQI
jgi:hypothetical protein